MNIAAIIMASGFSSRMGRNKLLLELGSRTVAEHVLDTVAQCGFGERVVVTQYAEIVRLTEEHGMRAVWNPNAILGQSASVKLGVAQCPGAEGFAFFAADQPFVRPQTVRALTAAAEERKDDIIAATYQGNNALPVIFPSGLWEDLLLLEGDSGARSLMRKYPRRVWRVEMSAEEETWDIDCEADYARALAYVRAMRQ